MQRKLTATLTIAIFLISTFAIVAPAQAHFTLGNLTGTFRYHANDFDPHVAGPVGYVWPGGGLNSYSGFPNVATSALGPGYQSPYPGGNPPGAPSQSWYQLESNAYAPFGAVLTDSTGDLIFGLNATCTPSNWNFPESGSTTDCSQQFDGNDNGVTKAELQRPTLSDSKGWVTWIILIPPEFTVPGAASGDSSQIVSTLTNSYERYLVVKLGPDDRYAPDWTLLALTVDGAVSASGSPSSTGSGTPFYNHQFINFTAAGEWYFVRINGVTAPSIAGRYFFKMALSGSFPTSEHATVWGVGPTLAGAANGCENLQQDFNAGSEVSNADQCAVNPSVWVPPQNWPVVLVKGETDPAIITGTLRYGGYNATLYGEPIGEAGKVWAKMTSRIDPYTGQSRPDLPTVDAQAYVNATANGHFEVEGLAPGVYDLYVEAAGYPQLICASGITVLKGQSLHFDCYLQPGPVIHGNVFTKHQFGDEPWPGNSTTGQYMKIELYSNPTLSNIVDPSAGPRVSWSPLPCVAGGQEFYYGGRAAGLCGDPRDGGEIAFPWHEYSTVNGVAYGDPNTLFVGQRNGYTRDVAISDVLGSTLLGSDPEGVGPPQHWFVAGGTTTPFHFEFGLKGEYGAPRDLSGEVPQVYATWINGLTPGRYYVRAWTFRYVQTALDGSTFQEYYFDITPNEWAGDVTLPIDLRLSSWVDKIVYFHDTPNTIVTSPIHSGAGYIWGVLTGADGHVYSANVTGLGLLEQNTTGINDNHLTTGQAVHPAYYYFTTTSANTNQGGTNACFQYDQLSYEFQASNGGAFATGEAGAPSQDCPFPTGNGNEVSALDKAGLNANSLATGVATIQFWGINDTWGGENYGIPSGTYTPNVAVDGYSKGSATPEQVSVTLSGNPTSISDHLFLAPGFNVSITSIDWEHPRVSRNWVWSGCQDNELPEVNSAGTTLSTGCIGSEIDVGFYPVVNGTAGAYSDYFGPESTLLPPTINAGTDFGGDFQGPGGIDCRTGTTPAFTCSEIDGGGRNVLPGFSNAHDAYFGQSAVYAFVGGYTPSSFSLSKATQLLQDSMWTTPILTWPKHFTEGQYNLAAYTYGYIQDKDFSAYAMNGQVADMKINLIIGVNVTLDILFKKESIITGTPFNMSARVRLFNDQGQLVATWMSSEGTYVDRNGHAIAANAVLPAAGGVDAVGSNAAPLYPFNTQGGSPFTQTSSNLNGYNYLPGGTNLLHVLLAGLPQQIPLGSDITGIDFSDPVFTPFGTDFGVDGYIAAYGHYPFPNTGIAGAPDYTGGWTAEVDFVPRYGNNTGTPQLLDPNQCQTDFTGACVNIGTFPRYYPPVNGLLMGESYHIIPGTTATSGISLTEDAAQSSTFVGHTMAPNHLGPYSQESGWQIAGTHNSGEASAIFEVDLNGFVSGNMLAFTWSNEFRTLSWGTISVTGASGATWNFYTYDGIYEAFLPTGNYKFSISEPGYAPQTWSASVSSGQTGTGQNVYLEQSNIPVPEFSGVAVVAFSALAASVYLLKRRRK